MISLDVTNMTGECANCGPVGLRLVKRAGKAVQYQCSIAKLEWARSNPDKAREWKRRNRDKVSQYNKKSRSRHHGLTGPEAEAYTAGKLCEICGSTRKLVVDHCHESSIIRGALCNTCNRVLGLFCDDPARFRRAAEYLDAARVGS